MNKVTLKSLATTLGKLLGFIGLTYVLYRLYQDYTFHSFLSHFNTIFSYIPLLVIMNIVSILLGIIVWHMLLQHYTKKPFPFLLSYYYYAKTEIAKYLPGNVFHLIGRQAIANKIDVFQKDMAKVSFLFTINIFVGTVFSTALFSLYSQQLIPYQYHIICISIIITFVVIYTFLKHFKCIEKLTFSFYNTLAISLQGLMLGVIIMQQIEAIPLVLFVQLAAIYIISWILGFITPGASGGLGIREGTFIAITTYLQLSVDENIIVFSVLLVRLINILVDILLFLSTFLLKSKLERIH